MPQTRATIRPNARIHENELFLACRQVVPASYTVADHPHTHVTPGSINFDPRRLAHAAYQPNDVTIDVEGFWYTERDMQEAADAIEDALHELFPGVTFSVWPKVVQAGYATDSEDEPFNGDLGMVAAIARAQLDIGRFRHLHDLDRVLQHKW